MSAADLRDRIIRLCDDITPQLGSSERERVRQIRQRLAEPLRLAIAGRAKAGKSTLLNALVGERLAATDAAEATRLVTWYRHGITYDVSAVTRAGESISLPFRRSDRLDINLHTVDPGDLERLDVRWPAARLQNYILVDTPGLASTDEVASARTTRALLTRESVSSQVDAVLYVMRHVHSADVDFLDAFADPMRLDSSPVTAIAVLSRADEIAGARVHALDAARRAAQHYADDPRLSARCSAVVPVAGLLAETAASLREDEARTIRALADLPAPDAEQLLLSTDRFIDPNRSDLPATQRAALLERLGIFGVRWSIDAYRSRRIQSAADLARGLRDVSGIAEVTTHIDKNLAARAETLKARSALSGLLTLAQAPDADPELARRITTAVEEIETTAPQFQDLRLWHLITNGTSRLTPDQVSEVARITANRSSTVRLNLPHDSTATTIAQAALAGAQRWRRQTGNPLATRTDVEAYESIARIYERLYHEQQR